MAAAATGPGADGSNPDGSGAEGSEPQAVHPAVLRDMAAADIDFITELDRMLFGVDSWPRGMFVDELSRPETRRYIIAEVPGVGHGKGAMEVVGYAGLMCVPPMGDVQTIGVLPAFEGRGIARAMLDELIAEAVRRGAQELMLEVSANNPRAQNLYRRYGFDHIHTRRSYYRDGSDGLVMRLALPPTTPETATSPAAETDATPKDPS